MNIPNTDLGELFPLGLGCVGAGSKWQGAEAAKIFDTYVGNGGNVLDTARVYSVIGKSEPAIGEWLTASGKRHEVIIIGKGGHPEIKSWPPNMHAFRLGREEMKADLEASLIAMGTDYIDIYLYHRDDPTRSVEELTETMQDFVREGKIRYFGVSNWTLPRLQELRAYCQEKGYRGPVMNQSLINAGSAHINFMWDDTLVVVDEKMQQFHRKIAGSDHDILCTGFSGNCGGFFQKVLTGGLDSIQDPTYKSEENARLAKEMEQAAKEHGFTMLQEVLAFYKRTDFPCMGLFGPRDARGIAEAMEIFR